MSVSSKPNVVVFFTDQQRWDTTGVHGNPMNLTPNFDEMAVEGTHFWNGSHRTHATGGYVLDAYTMHLSTGPPKANPPERSSRKEVAQLLSEGCR